MMQFNPADYPYDYPYIRAWCRLINTTNEYMEQELRRARMMDAPQNATWYDIAAGNFHTADTIRSGSTAAELALILDDMRRRAVREQRP